MSSMNGLELVVIGRTRFFELRYENGRYLDPAGKEVEDLMDLTCFNCGSPYYTLDGDEQIEFCPNCGAFYRREFKKLADLLEWSRTQNWDFLRFSGNKAFAVNINGLWELRFARDQRELLAKGHTDFQQVA